MRRDTRFRDHRPSTPLPGSLLDAVRDGRPFVASEALEAGLVTRYGLRSRFRMLVPGVYHARGSQLTKWDRIRAVGMWSPADAVIGGWAAAYLHGERWFSRDASRSVIDVYTSFEPRMPPGVRERRLRYPIPPEDICEIGGLRVTAPARTAVDVARWTNRADSSICMMDSVCEATSTSVEEVAGAAARMRGQHGVRRVVRLLDSCDAAAQSPQESILRLRIERSTLPRPTSQHRIFDHTGELITVADLAYAAEKVAIFYDGKHHGDSEQWRRDLRITARLTDLGWQVVRAAHGMKPDEVLSHIANALSRARARRRG